MSDGGRWQPVTAGYPPDGVLVLTKVKRDRDRYNRFVRFLMRLDGNRWVTGLGAKIGWHPTHWLVDK